MTNEQYNEKLAFFMKAATESRFSGYCRGDDTEALAKMCTDIAKAMMEQYVQNMKHNGSTS